jgi:hypothetical protein
MKNRNTRRTRKQEKAMRMTVVAGLVFGLVLAQTDHGHAQPSPPYSGTPSELADDAVGGALWRIAVATQTTIGFESVEFVQVPVRLNNVPAFPISSRDEALNAVVEANPRYEWRAIGEVVVVRPKNAWNDSSNPFNRPVRNLRIENVTPYGVVLGVRDFIYTNRLNTRFEGQESPVSFEVLSGTVVDVLNRVAEASSMALWMVSYRPHAQAGQRFPRWDLQMQLRDATTMRNLSESWPMKTQ